VVLYKSEVVSNTLKYNKFTIILPKINRYVMLALPGYPVQLM